MKFLIPQRPIENTFEQDQLIINADWITRMENICLD
jgi:hypothetical protein